MSISSKSREPKVTASDKAPDNLTDGKISIGYISAAHGVKGEVRIVPLTDFPERFDQMDVLNLYLDGKLLRNLKVLLVRKHEGKGELIIESDIQNRDEAELLVGASVLIDPDERVLLPEGSYWIDDLIGLQVVDKNGEVLGVVENLLSTGGKEVYEIKDGNGRLHYIPAVDDFIKDIDLPAGKIRVELIEGLW